MAFFRGRRLTAEELKHYSGSMAIHPDLIAYEEEMEKMREQLGKLGLSAAEAAQRLKVFSEWLRQQDPTIAPVQSDCTSEPKAKRKFRFDPEEGGGA